MFAYRWAWSLVLMAAGLLAGCGGGGDDGPQRYNLSGSVTYNGQPVPYGQINFEPDAVAGNSGPQGAAEIRDGRYDTSADGRGIVGGPHRIRIQGFDRLSEDETNPAKPLFPEYETTLDLPKEDGTQDFQIPAAAGP